LSYPILSLLEETIDPLDDDFEWNGLLRELVGIGTSLFSKIDEIDELTYSDYSDICFIN